MVFAAGLPIPDESHSHAEVLAGGRGDIPVPTAFPFDPLIREEKLTFRASSRRRVVLMHRKSGSTTLRGADGTPGIYPLPIGEAESAISQIREPVLYPELAVLREEIAGWRFYHHFRTDPESPLRHPQVGVRTPVLSADGRDLAAALQTIYENGEGQALAGAVEAAFPGSRLRMTSSGQRFLIQLSMRGLERPLEARELSDGTLRYLCLLAALLSPRPPQVLALNEPETGLHPDLLEPLARLVVRTSERSQLWITTHSRPLAEAIGRLSGQRPVRLEKVNGETCVVGQGALGNIRDEEEE